MLPTNRVSFVIYSALQDRQRLLKLELTENGEIAAIDELPIEIDAKKLSRIEILQNQKGELLKVYIKNQVMSASATVDPEITGN